MSKLSKFVWIGLAAISVSILSSSIYADKGGNRGQGNSGAMYKMGHNGKGQKHFKGMKKGHNFDGHGVKNSLPVRSPNVAFSDNDRGSIANFFSAHPSNATGLPPGIAMNLARGKPLPPGIAKVFLPQDLVRSIGYHPGYDYLVAGNDVLLVNRSDQIIADVLYNILH